MSEPSPGSIVKPVISPLPDVVLLRSNSISTNTIKTHNQILEQTTLKEYTDNFKRIFACLNKWNEDKKSWETDWR